MTTNDNSFATYRAHVLARIEACSIGKHPFHHTFIERIFPDDLYESLCRHMLSCKRSDKVQDRLQDNPAFTNRRYNLSKNIYGVAETVRSLFSDQIVKQALLKKFYYAPSPDLLQEISIHEEEFEYIFTAAGRFQNIHIDIPPKFLSFVFYIPERAVPAFEEERNATVLYDKYMKPHYRARYRKNSVCIFVPHFYSYHGFSSTIARDVLVMFYIHPAELQKWRALRDKDEPPFNGLLDAIEDKLRRHPLKEFGDDEKQLRKARLECRVNAPKGRVLTNDFDNDALPGDGNAR